MRMHFRLIRTVKGIALLAMLLPFLALSALPPGTMPGASSAGTLTLVLCTSDGPQEITVDLAPEDGKPLPPGCPWAVAHAAVALPDGPGIPLASLTLTADEIAENRGHLHPAHLPDHGAARAPPALA